MMKSTSSATPIVVKSVVLASFLAACAVTAAGCGVQEHHKEGYIPPPSSTGGNTGTTGTGGTTSIGSGGQAASSGGTSGGSGGKGSGGNQPASSGGNGNGSGGINASGSGGNSTNGTGGNSSTSTGGKSGTGGANSSGSGGAASGVTINIAGTMVPKEKAITIIHLGHSNMLGHAAKPANLQSYFYTTQPGLWIYRGSNNFVLAKEPTAPSVSTDMGAGPGMAILKTAAAMAPADYHFISIGRGEGSATSVDWQKGGNLYPAIMTRALELKGKVTFGAIFIMLGITERHLPAADQPGFPGRIQQLVKDLRADLGEPNIPVLFCAYEQNATGELAPTGAVGMAAIPMINSLPGLITNLKLVPTDGLGMQDDHHFDFSGQQVWSQRGIKLMVDNNWFPWTK